MYKTISLFINEHINEICKVTESNDIKSILLKDDYYFSRAQTIYVELKNLCVKDAILDNIISQLDKRESFMRLSSENQLNSSEKEILMVVSKLLYILNNDNKDYSENNSIMRFAFSRVEILFLLKYMKEKNIDLLPKEIKNMIEYLDQPDKVIPTFLYQKDNKIFKYIMNYGADELFKCFHENGIKPINPLNRGYIYSKILNSTIIKELWNSNNIAWAFTPEYPYLWNEFKNKGIIAIGWDYIGDLTNFNSESAIREELKVKYGIQNNHITDSRVLWQFCNEIQIGDKIYVQFGSSSLVGIGVVTSDYHYDNSRGEYMHVRYIEWNKIGYWKLGHTFWVRTLRDLTEDRWVVESFNKYPEYAKTVNIVKGEGDIFYEKYEPYSKLDFLKDVFLSDKQYETLKSLLVRKKNLILKGVPGVGKTYIAKRLAYSIMGEKDEERVKFIQFHQSYSYEDFIMGYRPDDNVFSLKGGIFYKFCKEASKHPNKPYYLIIDEINRGNLSKIFGEILTLIEADKRGDKIELTYSDLEFSVPRNLYIIGMMNTADRSLTMIDYALRRRFSFYELKPAFKEKKFKQYLLHNGVDDALVNKIILKFTNLNDNIQNNQNLGSGFCIGHSYFCDCRNSNGNWYEEIIRYDIAPLLEDYWLDDNENAKKLIDELLE